MGYEYDVFTDEDITYDGLARTHIHQPAAALRVVVERVELGSRIVLRVRAGDDDVVLPCPGAVAIPGRSPPDLLAGDDGL
jgi:hypothetical protein